MIFRFSPFRSWDAPPFGTGLLLVRGGIDRYITTPIDKLLFPLKNTRYKGPQIPMYQALAGPKHCCEIYRTYRDCQQKALSLVMRFVELWDGKYLPTVDGSEIRLTTLGMFKKETVNNGINYQPSAGEFTGFLNKSTVSFYLPQRCRPSTWAGSDEFLCARWIPKSWKSDVTILENLERLCLVY